MKRILPILIVASLAITGCSKSSSDDPVKQIEEIAVDKIKAKYISVLPELKDYAHAYEGMTKDKNYKVVVGRNDIDYMVAYIDASGKVYLKKTAQLDTSLKNKINSVRFYPSDVLTEGNAVLLMFEGPNVTSPGLLNISFEVIFPSEGKLINVGRNLSNDVDINVNSLTFTNKTVWFYSNGKIYMYDRSTGKIILETADIPHDLLKGTLTSFFFENNKMILIEGGYSDLKIFCHSLTRSEGHYSTFWTGSISGKCNIAKEDIEITDDADYILIKLKGIAHIFKLRKIDGGLR
ncbi:hypothetical protein [Sphingobacterium kitahiroshimense]|uniref:hypothetical protein n=1 Tax=Sphingobacterium kitahiroshimense TaxID=470446 RepID=UPI0032090116